MKNILGVLSIIMLLIAAPVHAEGTKDIIVKVDGMVCDFCAQSLTKIFGKEDSVNDIDVSLDDQTVTIDTKDDQDLPDEKIKELIEWGGYDLVEIKR